MTLATPVTHRGTEYSELTFRVPTLADVRALRLLGTKEDEADSAVMYDHVMQYAERLCTSLPKEAFGQITVEDSYAIVEAVAPLFGKPPVGG